MVRIAICPNCGGIIERDDTYDSYPDVDYIVYFCIGHCVECETEYQWKEIYDCIEVKDIEEVT